MSFALLSALCSCPEGLLRICRGGTKDIPGVSGRSCSSWGKLELNRQRQSVGGFRTRERAVKLGTIGAPGDVSGHKPNSRVLGIPCIPMLALCLDCSLVWLSSLGWWGWKSRRSAAASLTQKSFPCKMAQSCQPLHWSPASSLCTESRQGDCSLFRSVPGPAENPAANLGDVRADIQRDQAAPFL